MSTKTAPKKNKEAKLNEAQFKEVVRRMARKAIKEHVARKTAAKAKLNEGNKNRKPAPKKISKNQLREMVRDSILECLEEELDTRLKAKKNKKPAPKK